MVLFFLLIHKSKKLRWISRHDCVCRNVLRHNASCSNYCVFTHRDVAQNRGSRADRGAFANSSLFRLAIGFRLQAAAGKGRAWVDVVNKRHAVSDKHVVLDFHPFANERMTGNLAAAAYTCVFLNFDKRPNFGVIANLASVKIDEFRKFDVFPQLHAGCDANVVVHSVMASPRVRMDRSAASRIRTTRRPASPSLNGLVFSSIHLMKYAVSARSASTCSTCGPHISPER